MYEVFISEFLFSFSKIPCKLSLFSAKKELSVTKFTYNCFPLRFLCHSWFQNHQRFSLLCLFFVGLLLEFEACFLLSRHALSCSRVFSWSLESIFFLHYFEYKLAVKLGLNFPFLSSQLVQCLIFYNVSLREKISLPAHLLFGLQNWNWQNFSFVCFN